MGWAVAGDCAESRQHLTHTESAWLSCTCVPGCPAIHKHGTVLLGYGSFVIYGVQACVMRRVGRWGQRAWQHTWGHKLNMLVGIVEAGSYER